MDRSMLWRNWRETIDYTSNSNCDLLQKEFSLLLQCHKFKDAFDQLAKDAGCNLPGQYIGVQHTSIKWVWSTDTNHTLVAFYFNYPRAILGRLITLVAEVAPAVPLVPHAYFITTPLLACGEYDKGVIKYSGQLGFSADPDPSGIRDAVHAFVHFLYIWSKGFMIFSDLQGVFLNSGNWVWAEPKFWTHPHYVIRALWFKQENVPFWSTVPYMHIFTLTPSLVIWYIWL